VQGNLELQLSKLLDDTEDEASSNAWSAGSSSSSIEQLSPVNFVGGMGMFEGASNSNLELSNNPVQPLGVELAAALDSSSQYSSDSEETVGEEDGSVLCVHNNAVDFKDGWVGSDNELSTAKADKDKDVHPRRPSSAMYPSSSASNLSDSDSNDGVCIRNPSKQYSVFMTSESSSTPQSNEAENINSTESINLHIEQSPISQETTESIPPVENRHLGESAPISLETEASTKQGKVSPLINSHLCESPIPTSPLEQGASTNAPTVTKPPTSSNSTCLSEEADIKSGTSEDSRENELELIKLQVCLLTLF